MLIGFTKDLQHVTWKTDQVDAEGKAIWAVDKIPGWWHSFGRPARRDDGEYGMLGSCFWPLSVLHGLKL